MERNRIDLSGGAKPSTAGRDPKPPSAGDKKKNAILLSIAAGAFVVAAYFIYANYIATPGAPAEVQSPQIDAVFEDAAETPPPPEPEGTWEQGGGKRASPQ